MSVNDQSDVFKVILVGNTGVGKTCLIRSFQGQKFEETTETTIAPGYSSHPYTKTDGKKCVMQIWDTAGQEKYQAVSQLFFRNADIALMCFVAGDKESMKATHDWISMVKNESTECALLFVATKADLIPPDQGEIAIKEAQAEFQQYKSIGFFLTSSKTRYNVDNVFNAAGEFSEFGKAEKNQMDFQKKEKSCC